MRENSKRATRNRVIGYLPALAAWLVAGTASAEVTIVKTDTWELYATGRVNAFFSYAFGDAYPLPLVNGHTIVKGGGVDDQGFDVIPKTDASGMPDSTQQGTLSKMRVRSGAIPNILSFGVRKKLGNETLLKAQLSLWGQIESDRNTAKGVGQLPRPTGRSIPVIADFREGYLQVDAPWGVVTGGRFLSPFSRGATETDMLYAHGYGVGFPAVGTADYVSGSLSLPGPTGGMIGFGVLGATYAAGLAYTTPNLGGVKLTAGLFDPVALTSAGWSTTRGPRPEGEITYDLAAGAFKMHLFGSGAFQKNYSNGRTDDTTAYGAAYGGRFEVGPVHLGVAGHYGKGVGVNYAFDSSATVSSSASTPPNQLRVFNGYSVIGQVVVGQFDLSAAYGVTLVDRNDADRLSTDTESLLKSQTGISAGVVYHVNENFHLDVDFINAAFAWYEGESQKVNFINSGATVTW